MEESLNKHLYVEIEKLFGILEKFFDKIEITEETKRRIINNIIKNNYEGLMIDLIANRKQISQKIYNDILDILSEEQKNYLNKVPFIDNLIVEIIDKIMVGVINNINSNLRLKKVINVKKRKGRGKVVRKKNQ